MWRFHLGSIYLKFIVSKYDRNTISNCYVVSVFPLSGRYSGNGRVYRAVSRQGNLGEVCALLQAIFGVIIDFGDLR